MQRTLAQVVRATVMTWPPVPKPDDDPPTPGPDENA